MGWYDRMGWDLVLDSDGWRMVEATWRGSDRRTRASETSRASSASERSFFFLYSILLTAVLYGCSVGMQRLTSVVCRRVEVVDETHEKAGGGDGSSGESCSISPVD